MGCISAAGVVLSLIDGRIPLCLTYPKTFNAIIRLFVFFVFLFGGLCFVQGSEPLFREGVPQTTLFTVLFSFLLCMFSSSSLLTISAPLVAA